MADIRQRVRTNVSTGTMNPVDFRDREQQYNSTTKAIYLKDPNGILYVFPSLIDGGSTSDTRTWSSTTINNTFIQKFVSGVENNISIFDDAGSIKDSGYHISDLSTTSTNLWSSQKTKEYIDSKIRGLDWQGSVHSFYDPTSALPSDVEGVRYISQATANGWTVNYIYEGTGGDGFTEIIPNEGYATWAENDSVDEARLGDICYLFTGSVWTVFSSEIPAHNDLTSLQGGTSGEYYHLSLSHHTNLTGGGHCSDTVHHHDSRYYTETEIDNLIDPAIVTPGTYVQVVVNSAGRVTSGGTAITVATTITASSNILTTSGNYAIGTTPNRVYFENSTGSIVFTTETNTKEILFKIGSAATAIAKITASGVEPNVSTADLGATANRWDTLYVVNVDISSTLTAPTINATTQFQLNGTPLASTHLSDSANIAHINETETISSSWTFSNATTTFSNASALINATGSTSFTLRQTTSGNALIQIEPVSGASSSSTISLFRNVNTSGTVKLSICRGNNSSTETHVFTAGSSPSTVFNNGSGTAVWTCTSAGQVTQTSNLIVDSSSTAEVRSDSGATSTSSFSIYKNGTYMWAWLCNFNSSDNLTLVRNGVDTPITIGSTAGSAITLARPTNITGALDVSSTIQAGSSNVTLTSAAGNLLIAALDSSAAATNYGIIYNGSSWVTANSNRKAIVLTPMGAILPTSVVSPAELTDTVVSFIPRSNLAFDQTTQEYVFYQLAIPQDMKIGTTSFTVDFYWFSGTAVPADPNPPHEVRWTMASGPFKHNDSITSIANAVSVSSTNLGVNKLTVASASGTWTITSDHKSTGCLFIYITRDTAHADDDLPDDARLLFTRITYESTLYA